MKLIHSLMVPLVSGLVGLGFVSDAYAQDDDWNDETAEERDEDDDTRDTPEPPEDRTAKPTPPVPPIPQPDDVRPYAGVGSGIAYAEQGVAEFGGSLSFSAGNDFTSFSADPMVGYFPWDNIEISAILGMRSLTVDGDSRSTFTLLAEPSLHVPLTEEIFAFGGLGMGIGVAPGENRVRSGVAAVPRVGVQFMVGRSGLLNLGARYSLTFATAETDLEEFQGAAVLAFVNTFDIQAGYTVMF